MTDWEEPLVEGEQYAGLIGPGVVKGALRPVTTKVSKLYQELMDKAAIIRKMAPDDPELVARETEGRIHAHPNPGSKSFFGVVPHGDVNVPRVKQLPESGVYAGEIYRSPELAEHLPDVLNTKIYPKKGINTGFGYFQPGGEKPGIYLHPNQLISPDTAKPLLAHELTHASAALTDPTGTYGGGSIKHFQELANKSQLPEQWQLAQHIRAGAPYDPNLVPKALLNANERDVKEIKAIVETIQLLRDKGFAGEYYNNLLGEGLARYIAKHPNSPLSPSAGTAPWKREGWDASRRMKGTLHGRIEGAISSDPTKSSMSNPGDIETILHILNR